MSERELSRAVFIERSIIKKYQKSIWHRFIGGCKDYALLKPGDAVAVCISGGKDSFLLAKCMQQLQKHSDVPFTLQFLCMDPGYRAENRALIEKNAALLGIALHIFETDIFDTVARETHAPCYLCARMRRGYLYKNARALGCNKIALGHHFDDVIETALMSMLWGAEIKTMLPKLHSTNYAGMELIRPLYLVREADIIAWKNYNELEFLQCACRRTEQRGEGGTDGGKRSEMKALLAQLKAKDKQVDINIFRSLHNINLGAVPGTVQHGVQHSFLEGYD
ncbi:MAG: ATP-binding protein, partial [Ruthenibacterium sp.]